MKKRNGLNFQLSDVKRVISKWLYLEDQNVVDVMMAVYVANKLNADPVWQLFIGAPSNAKTELLRSFDGYEGAYFLSNLTPATLVSGQLVRKGRSDPSLLLRLNNKIVILKDFTSVLSMRSENQQEILAQFREAYDGQYSKTFGNGKEINWKGQFGLMAACTPVYDAHYAVIGSMGERFLIYRIERGDDEKTGRIAQDVVNKAEEMRNEIREAVHRFIKQFESLDNIEVHKDEVINSMIRSIASFCAYGRCPVRRDHYGNVTYSPMPEGTPRLVKQFMQMAVALAIVQGKTRIDMGVYEIIKKIARDLLPTHRLKILEYLWNEIAFEMFNHDLKTKELAVGVNLPPKTTLRTLEDLMLVEMLNRHQSGDGENVPYHWQLNQKTEEWIEHAKVFNSV